VIQIIRRKFVKSLQVRGVWGTAWQCVRFAVDHCLEWTPRRRRARAHRVAKDREFDERYGVDTGGRIDLDALEIEAENWRYGGGYAPSPVVDIGKMLAPFGIPVEEYVFIDLGSGKGRILLLASHVPFKRIVGVEFAAQLHRIAEENVRSYHGPDRRGTDVELRHMDAAAYPFPDEPCVLWLYNPFGMEVMTKVVANLEASLQRCPRDAIVIYLNPLVASPWDNSSLFENASKIDNFSIYRSVVGRPGAITLPDRSGAVQVSAPAVP
jgi:hypothetical protein